jgi:hypothetical protein
MTPLDLPCPVCHAAVDDTCKDKDGNPYPPHRGRAVAVQNLLDIHAPMPPPAD